MKGQYLYIVPCGICGKMVASSWDDNDGEAEKSAIGWLKEGRAVLYVTAEQQDKLGWCEDRYYHRMQERENKGGCR